MDLIDVDDDSLTIVPSNIATTFWILNLVKNRWTVVVVVDHRYGNSRSSGCAKWPL